MKNITRALAVYFGMTLLGSEAHAIQPSPYIVVADDYIAPHKIAEHEDALRAFKVQADKAGYQGSWRFYQFDDGRHVAFSARQSHDHEAQQEAKWQQVADKFDDKFLAENSEVYRDTITHQDFYLMRYNEALSLMPKQQTTQPMSHLVYMEINVHSHTSITPALSRWIEQQKQTEQPLHFSAYSKQYGSNMPTLYLVFAVDSFPEFYQTLAKKGVFDPVQLFPEDVKKAIKSYTISLAKYLPEISY